MIGSTISRMNTIRIPIAIIGAKRVRFFLQRNAQSTCVMKNTRRNSKAKHSLTRAAGLCFAFYSIS